MIVSIHQPSFIPWLPYFEKIREADVFVILSHCQFQKGNYQNRFNYNDKWHTMSVNSGFDSIVDKKYVSFEKDWSKIKTNLKEKRRILDKFDKHISESMNETNIKIILDIVDMLEIKTKIVFDEPTELTSTERLIDICKKNNATTYLSGPSGSDYMDFELFRQSNISVKFQETKPENKIHILDVL
jgi:hypothetical protein